MSRTFGLVKLEASDANCAVSLQAGAKRGSRQEAERQSRRPVGQHGARVAGEQILVTRETSSGKQQPAATQGAAPLGQKGGRYQEMRWSDSRPGSAGALRRQSGISSRFGSAPRRRGVGAIRGECGDSRMSGSVGN
jgi:hypothetical protein